MHEYALALLSTGTRLSHFCFGKVMEDLNTVLLAAIPICNTLWSDYVFKLT